MLVTQYFTGGKTRCVQAAFRMVVCALVGEDPGEADSDLLTGFVEGRGTWQFKMLLAFAKLGLNSIDHEKFDIMGFIEDPERAIRNQVKDEEAALGIIEETDVKNEQQNVKDCIKSPLIQFIDTAPSFDDIQYQISLQRLLLVNVNLRVLQNEIGREGHVLIVEHIDADNVTVHDPGPNGGLGVKISRKLFEAAWTSPSEEMANYISVWREPLASKS